MNARKQTPQSQGEITTPTKPNPTYKNFLPAIISAFVDYFGLGCITPLLPFFVAQYSGNPIHVGYILSAQYGGVILGSTIVGFVSDRIGRRNALMVALTGDVIFFTLTGFVTSVRMMLFVRFFAGFFTPLSACIAWVNDASGDNVQVRV